MRDRVGFIAYDEFKLTVFDGRFDSPNRKTVLDSYYSLLFSLFRYLPACAIGATLSVNGHKAVEYGTGADRR